ncbi:MAG: hypothetical protein AAF433_14445 [Bacteroidota bacterium]
MNPLPLLDFDAQAHFPELIQADAFQLALSQVLPDYMNRQRWFTSKGKAIQSVQITHAFPLTDLTAIILTQVDFTDSSREHYQLPIAWNWEPEWLDDLQNFNSHLAIAQIDQPAKVILSDAINRASFRRVLFQRLLQKDEQQDGLSSDQGRLLTLVDPNEIESTVPHLDTSNTAIIYNGQFFYKLFRKLDEGLNPDLELVRFLSEQSNFDNSPRYGGSLSLGKLTDDNFINLGICIGKIDNHGDAWDLFQQLSRDFYARVLDYGVAAVPNGPIATSFADLSPTEARLIGKTTYQRVQLLGQRTAEMHLALASEAAQSPVMVPEPLSEDYRKEISAAALHLFDRQLVLLQNRIADLDGANLDLAQRIIAQQGVIRQRLAALRDRPMPALLTRIHGDYHLGQVLYDDHDFYIIDFEGEPLLSIPERQRKRPPFKDVAGMIRSLHYAARGQLLLNFSYRPEDVEALGPWGNWWFRTLRAAYLNSYLSTIGDHPMLPPASVDQELLLDIFVLEKAVYEVAYELNSRPDWLGIPLQGVLFALEDAI